jgi:small subunit ribosomal protein S6
LRRAGPERSNLRKYELTYLVSDEVPESDLNKVTGKVTGLVSELGGKITKEDIWGRRKLAYPIRKQDFATYITLYFNLPAKNAAGFEKDLRHIDGILRQLMIVKDLGDEEISLTQEEIADTSEIKDVIGGERSFESVEGETEDSRSLMAKREEEAAEEVETTKEEKVEEKPAEEPKKTPKAKAVKEIKETETKEEKPKADTEKTAEGKTETKAKRTTKKKEETSAKATEDKKVNDEVERLSKLNEELDDILKDEL